MAELAGRKHTSSTAVLHSAGWTLQAGRTQKSVPAPPHSGPSLCPRRLLVRDRRVTDTAWAKRETSGTLALNLGVGRDATGFRDR